MAETVKVRNVSGTDLEVPLPTGGAVTVEAGHQHEFEAEHAASLLEQPDTWHAVAERKRAEHHSADKEE